MAPAHTGSCGASAGISVGWCQQLGCLPPISLNSTLLKQDVACIFTVVTLTCAALPPTLQKPFQGFQCSQETGRGCQG